MIHKEAAAGRWFEFSLMEQLANIGADVGRANRWKKAGVKNDSLRAFERALELFDLTVADPKNKGRLKEVVRVREFFIDYYMFDNAYGFTDESWEDYFYSFNYAAALAPGR